MTRRQQERLALAISQHKGQWVLVKGNEVVAGATSIKDAINSLPKAERRRVRAQYCPTEDYAGVSFSAL